MKRGYLLLAIFGVALAGIIDFPGEHDAPVTGGLVAYRGGGQLINYAAMGKNACGAKHILENSGPYIENTLEGIDQATKLGFDTIHLNIQITADGHFVAFHDSTLNCATNGTGTIPKHTLDDIRSLDAGYGYTFDNGETFPWRDKGIRIPTLENVIEQHPEKALWLNLKSQNATVIPKLREILDKHYDNDKSNIVFISSLAMADAYKKEVPESYAVSVTSTRRCFFDYLIYGWTKFYPQSCKETILLLPPDLAGYLWGWPENFALRAANHNTKVYLWTKHSKLEPTYDLRGTGVGVVTGDLSAFNH